MRSNVHGAFAISTLLAAPLALADDFFWQPTCDQVWQTCCPLGSTLMQNNWGRTSVAPVCPAQPTGADAVTIESDCTVGPTPSVSAGTIDQSNGTFTVTGALAIGQEAQFNGPVVWTAGEIGRSGAASGQFAQVNSGLTITGATDKTLSFFGGFTLINTNVGEWSGTGNMTIGMIPGGTHPSILRNAAGATFTVRNDARIFQTSFGPGSLENAGTLIKDDSSGTSTWDVSLFNSGLLHVKTGALRLTRAGEIAGTWQVDPGAEVQIAGNFFTLDPDVAINGRMVVMDSGTNPGIVVNEPVIIDDLTIAPTGITGGSALLCFNGTLTVEAGGIPSTPILILPGGQLVSQGSQRFGPLDIAGTAHLNAGATGSFGGDLNVIDTGEVIIADGATLGNSSLVVRPIHNYGLIRKNATAGVATIASAFNREMFHHADGLIDVPGGTMECACRLDTASEIHVAAGAVFRQTTWSNYRPGSSFTGDGTFVLTSQNNFVDADFELPVTNMAIIGTIGGGQGLFGPGTLCISRSLELQGGFVEVVTTVEAGAALNVIGPGFTQTKRWENYGVATVTGGGMNYFEPFTNHAGAVVDIQGDISFGGRFTNGIFHNQGLLKKSSGAGDSTMQGTLNNAGMFEIRSGRMVINTVNQSAGTTLLAGGGIFATVANLAGGTVTGPGTVGAAVSNTGAVVAPGSPIGVLQIAPGFNSQGDYTQGAAGSLRIELGGLAAGTQHDQLAVARNAALNGTLSVALINGYSPNVGDSFTILTTGGTRTGTFSQVSGVQIGGGKRLTVQYSANSVTVVVTNDGTTPGDIDGDGHVGLQDLATLLGSFGTCAGEGAFAAGADINGDGCVSINDLAILLGSFGT